MYKFVILLRSEKKRKKKNEKWHKVQSATKKNKTFVNFLALQVNKATKCDVKKNASEKWNLYIKLWSILKTVRRKQFYKLNATEDKTVNFVLFSKKQCSENRSPAVL